MQPRGASSTTVSVLNATQQDLYGPKNCCDIFTEPVLATIRFRLAVLVFYIAPSLNAIKERLENRPYWDNCKFSTDPEIILRYGEDY